ncbi:MULTISPECIES: YqzL family protein [Pelotomaculum]|nr:MULTISPECIES: YqzL family protein [Pelotomaculum]
MLLTAEFFWRMFEATGSVRAYMLYRRLAIH